MEDDVTYWEKLFGTPKRAADAIASEDGFEKVEQAFGDYIRANAFTLLCIESGIRDMFQHFLESEVER